MESEEGLIVPLLGDSMEEVVAHDDSGHVLVVAAAFVVDGTLDAFAGDCYYYYYSAYYDCYYYYCCDAQKTLKTLVPVSGRIIRIVHSICDYYYYSKSIPVVAPLPAPPSNSCTPHRSYSDWT